MAVTAIDHDGRVVTVISQLVQTRSPSNTSAESPFTTCIHGGPLNASMWLATSWPASLRNHAIAVSRVIDAMARLMDLDD
jgi:hypothetical protein